MQPIVPMAFVLAQMIQPSQLRAESSCFKHFANIAPANRLAK